MRIAYIAQSYPPMISGAAIFVSELAEGMAARGHQVLVIAASDTEQPYIVERENIKILRLKSFHNPMRVGQRVLHYPRRDILQALREFKPEIIHAHEPLISWIGYEYARQVNIPITLTMHMLPWFVTALLPEIPGVRSLAEAATWIYVRLMARKFTAIIATTKTGSDAVMEMTGVKAEIIHCGINMQTFQPRVSSEIKTDTLAKLNLPPKVPIILHVGRLDPEKRVDRIIRASAQAMSESNAHLLIVGDGCEKPALIKLSQSLGIAERTHFPGYISVQEGLPDVYRMADLFVMASEIEAQGIVLLEAAAAGLPIAAVNATAISEVVHDGINGYLSEPGDVQSLGNSIKTLLRSPKKSRQMGKESRSVAESYDIQHMQELHVQFYTKLIRRKRTLSTARIKRYAQWKRAKDWMRINK